jgi:superfamily II DNA/RNA helicase
MSTLKSQKEILEKLKIERLNPMQEAAALAIESSNEVVLLSPTGTGKTLAFLLPVIASLEPEIDTIQAMIIVPSRELALQIEQVIREMGTGYKVNAIYGGRAGSKDKIDLKHRPAILIGTPGRIADRMRRESFETDQIKTLILDEFDKSLEIGFELEMKEIFEFLNKVEKRILTSATQGVEIPSFARLRNPVKVDFLVGAPAGLKLKKVISNSKIKLDTLVETLAHIGNEPGIIFCNFKDTIQEVSVFLNKRGIAHGCFYGGMEQQDRERALIKFRNGTHQIIVATDLAARGLDIPELKFIIHYQLPPRSEEFTHRNGRTARMNTEGTAYILVSEKERLPDFIEGIPTETLKPASNKTATKWNTLFVSGGRKDKISKGDIAGVFIKQGGIAPEELGSIEIKLDCSFVAVAADKTAHILKTLDNVRIKTKRVRITII